MGRLQNEANKADSFEKRLFKVGRFRKLKSSKDRKAMKQN